LGKFIALFSLVSVIFRKFLILYYIMSLGSIITISVVILVFILMVNLIMSINKNQISSTQEGNVEKTITPAQLKGQASNTNNYTYSTWFYVDDWNYKYGQEKVILARMDASGNPCPKIALDGYQNNITVYIQTYPENATNTSAAQVFPCTLKNIPIQSWVHFIVSVTGRTCDLYLDGKLVKTCVLPGVAKIAANANTVITPKGGFSGYTANIKYFSNSINPQEAWNLYREGYGKSSIGNLYNKYKLKVALMTDNKESGSFQI
jgi:hypothetical protein